MSFIEYVFQEEKYVNCGRELKMHICIEMVGQKDIVLPIHYNHVIQGFIYSMIDREPIRDIEYDGSKGSFIYSMIDRELSGFLHNKGYGDGRKFKLFCFSNIIGKSRIDGESGSIVFK